MIDKNIILKSIDDAISKCGKPKHIQNLPHDLRTNDYDKLQERYNALDKELTKKSRQMVKKWHQITDMIDNWNKNIPKDENTQLEWEGVYALGDKLENAKYMLDSLEVSLNVFTYNKKDSKQIYTTDRTDGLLNKEDFIWMDTKVLCDYLIKWANQPWDWEGFNIKDMNLFKRRINALKKDIGIMDDYKRERYNVDDKLRPYRMWGDRVNAKVSGTNEVYDIANHTRGIREIHDEMDNYEDAEEDGGMFSIIADNRDAVERFGRKVGATEIHHEEGDLYTVLMPYKI